MSERHVRIGDMLVRAGLITEAQLEHALGSQKRSGRRLGEELVHLGYLSEVQMTQILSNQLSVPWVSLYHVEFSRELLNLIPAQTAELYGAIPVYVRQVRNDGATLFVAMDDPTNEEALRVLREACGMPVKPMVAPPSEIRNAVRVYYFGSLPPKPPAPEAKKRVSSKPPPPPPEAKTGKVPKVPPKEAPEKAEARPAKPRPSEAKPSIAPAPKAPKMITLTLLDGTTVKLPAPGGKKDEEPAPTESLTAGDLISALLAKSQGRDVSDVLPDVQWEVMFAALLGLLLRKGLIADWEFVEEYEKRRG